MFSKRIFTISCLLLLTITISIFIDRSRCEYVELVTNGGFENGINGWRSFSYCIQLSREGVVTDYRAHSGKYSLYTLCGTGGEHCRGVGGGASQEIQLIKTSNLKLQFNVYLFGTSQVNSWADIVLIVDFWIFQTKRTLVYYIAWAENIPIYVDFPTPTMTSENVKNILLSNIETDRWNNVQRDFDSDLKEAYPDIAVTTIDKVTITLLAVTFQRLTMTPMGAYWDDISYNYEPISNPTSTPTPSQTPSPTTSPTREFTPSPTSTISNQSKSCIIATAAYGSELAPEVTYMRYVRDRMIGSNQLGKILVGGWNTFYYSWSPPIAAIIADSKELQAISRSLLIPLIVTIHLTSFICLALVPINPALASIIAFLFAAFLSISIYITIPTLICRAVKKRVHRTTQLNSILA